MSILVTQSSRLGVGQLPATVAIAQQLAALHDRAGGGKPQLLEAIFGGDNTGVVHLNTEFDSYSDLAAVSEKSAADPEGRALLAQFTRPDLNLGRRLWREVAVGDPTSDADCMAVYTRASMLTPGKEWSDALGLLEQGKKVCMSDGASSFRVWGLEAGGGPMLITNIGFPSMSELWAFEEKALSDPAVLAMRMKTDGSSDHALTTVSSTINQRIEI